MTFQRIYTTIIESAPQLAPKNTHIIHEWLATYDTDKDILPAIAAAAKRGLKTIRSFSYFNGFIQKQHELRLKAEATKPADEMTIMRNRAWLRAKHPHLLRPDQREELNQYEQKHGEVRI